MLRNLRRRLRALGHDQDAEAVFAAVETIRRTGTAPPGPAGRRAAALWEESAGRGFEEDFLRALWCQSMATGKGLAELTHGPVEP